MNVIIVLGIMVCLFFIIGYIGYKIEKLEYNDGFCVDCGIKLRHFDNDSQGGRGYVCDKCGGTVWVSYPWVDK
jgi:DNA-directed RNA polymerase subunit RPC12/RpoP